MSKGNTFENDWLKLIFNNVAIALIGDAAGVQPSAAAGDLYVSLHTADPGEAGDQTTSEAAYTGYARVAVPRASTSWDVVANAVTNDDLIAFPICSAGTSTVTHFAVGTASAGAGKLLYSGDLNASLIINPGITPEYDPDTLIISEE